MPYFPYSRQSKKKSHRGAITARMLANLVKVAGVDHVITLDLHATQMQGFFKCPLDNLLAEPFIAKWIRNNVPEWGDAVVVSKNPGGTKRVTSLADALKLSFGIVTTDHRRNHLSASVHNSTTVLDTLGSDGTDARRPAEDGAVLPRTITPDRQLRDSDFPPRLVNSEARPGRLTSARTFPIGPPAVRSRHMHQHGDAPSSPLIHSQPADMDASEPKCTAATSAKGLEQISTALALAQQTARVGLSDDNDGYEEPERDDDQDEMTRDVVTGRLVQGRIIDDDDDLSSPNSLRSTGLPPRSSSDEADPPDSMLHSFVSAASSRMQRAVRHSQGGTGDATASDEEDADLQDPTVETTVTVVGNVRGRPVLIVDDILDQAGSWIAAAETVAKRGGATQVYCIATHGLLGGDALRDLERCDAVTRVVVTNAFPIPLAKRRQSSKLHVIDISPLLAEAIRRNHHGESISLLFHHVD